MKINVYIAFCEDFRYSFITKYWIVAKIAEVVIGLRTFAEFRPQRVGTLSYTYEINKDELIRMGRRDFDI